MPTITDFSVTPDEIGCGDRVTISVQVAFAGNPRDVTVACTIESPCSFSSDASPVAMTRFGPSPQSFRFTEKVRCTPGTHAPQITVLASDVLEAADQRSQGIIVDC
jgi:hypothetical protein